MIHLTSAHIETLTPVPSPLFLLTLPRSLPAKKSHQGCFLTPAADLGGAAGASAGLLQVGGLGGAAQPICA